MTSATARTGLTDRPALTPPPPATPLPAAAVPAPVRGTATVHRSLYLASALPLAALWSTVLITGWVVTVALAITPLLPAVLVAFAVAVRVAGWVEGYLARRLLGAPTRPRRLAAARRRRRPSPRRGPDVAHPGRGDALGRRRGCLTWPRRPPLTRSTATT